MDSEKLLRLIVLIVGKDVVTREMRSNLRALLESALNSQPRKSEPVAKEDVNEFKDDPNTIPLSETSSFKFPSEFNLETEGEEGIRKIKIFPDGVSEVAQEPEPPPVTVN
jgi:hypothetical protein